LSGLAGLTRLNLSSTQVIDISPLSGLTSLKRLNLNSTQVSDLRAISSLLKQYPLVHCKKSYGNGIHLYNCPLQDPPFKIVQQGTEAILRYWDLQDRAGKLINNEARILLVGEGGAGKTSLHKKIYNPEVLISQEKGKGKESATIGINVVG
jgi:hypothetical protein